MRPLPFAAAPLLITAPALADPGEIPLVAIGLPFAPETPTPVAPTHVLYQDVATGEIEALPATIKSTKLNFIPAAKAASVTAALSETLRRMNLLAPNAATARKRLSVRWISGGAPFRIASRNTASVTMHYRLARVDTGLVLFERDITTAVKGGGADASMRDNGGMRAAIAANFASAANCIDHATYAPAPTNCALTPLYSVSVTRERR